MSEVEWNDAGSHVNGTGYSDAAYPIYSALVESGLVSVRTHIERNAPEIPGVGYSLKRKTAELACPIVINNTIPELYAVGAEYSIGFTYWETNRISDDWVDGMNQMDEIWTTSKFMKNVFIKSGVTKPVYAFNLGVDPKLYFPHKKKPHKPFTFLSMGGPSMRKNSQMAVDAFLHLFSRDENYKLIYKY